MGFSNSGPVLDEEFTVIFENMSNLQTNTSKITPPKKQTVAQQLPDSIKNANLKDKKYFIGPNVEYLLEKNPNMQVVYLDNKQLSSLKSAINPDFTDKRKLQSAIETAGKATDRSRG